MTPRAPRYAVSRAAVVLASVAAPLAPGACSSDANAAAAQAEERGRQVVVVNIGASWRDPCLVETPHLEKVWTDLQAGGKPVQFMGINFRESPERAAAAADKPKMTYPSLTDESGVLILAFGRQAP